MYELAQGLVEREHSVVVVTPLSGYNLVEGQSNPSHEGRVVTQKGAVTVIRILTANFFNVQSSKSNPVY